MNKPNNIKKIIHEFNKQYKEKSENEITEKTLLSKLQKLKRSKQKYMDMYDNDIISILELRTKTKSINESILDLNEKIKLLRLNIKKSDLLKNNLGETFRDIESLLSKKDITNNLLSRVIQKITVDENGKVDVYLKLLNDIGLENVIQLCDCHTHRYIAFKCLNWLIHDSMIL